MPVPCGVQGHHRLALGRCVGLEEPVWPSGNPALPLMNCVVLVRPLNTPLCLSLPLCKMVIKKKQGLIGQRREGA